MDTRSVIFLLEGKGLVVDLPDNRLFRALYKSVMKNKTLVYRHVIKNCTSGEGGVTHYATKNPRNNVSSLKNI